MTGVKKNVMGFIFVAFALLGALFGMQIMTFIFAQLGPDAAGLTSGTTAYNISQAVQNNSLAAIETYTEQADTQFNTVGITITLLILIALFLVFWVIFIKPSSKGSSGGSFA